MYYSFKERLNLTPSQIEWCEKHAHMKRAVYNQCLAYNIRTYETTNTFVFGRELKSKLAQLKNLPQFEWLKECESTSVQQAVTDFDTALRNFLASNTGTRKGRIVKFPKFKKRHRAKMSFRLINTVGQIRVNHEEGLLRLPKIGWVKVWSGKKRLSRILTIGMGIKYVTVSRDTDNNWYASILVETVNPKFNPLCNKGHSSTGNTCGIDMGVKDFIITGDSTTHQTKRVDLPKRLFELEKLAVIYQRSYSRKLDAAKKRGADLDTAKNLCAARTKLRKIHYRIRKFRENFQHQLTFKLTQVFDVITVETLDIQNMLKKNRSLARAISRQSWYSFVTKLEYKMIAAGKILIKANQYFPSSQLCSNCNYQNTVLKAERVWTCPSCGTVHNRDNNASFNLDKISKYFLETGKAITTKQEFLQVM